MKLKVLKISVIIALISFAPDICVAENVLGENLNKYVTGYLSKFTEKPTLAVEVIDAESGSEIFGINTNELVKPASVLKLVTAYSALTVLGQDYRFPTEIFCDKLIRDTYSDTSMRSQLTGAVGNLYVRGYGDPSLVSEKMFDWAQTLRQLGVQKIQNIVVDDSLLAEPLQALGSDPYQAGNSALSLNHNSYAIQVAPAGTASPAIVTLTAGAPFRLVSNVYTKTVEKPQIEVVQTPQSSDYRRRVDVISPGLEKLEVNTVEVRVKGEIQADSAPIIQYQSVPDPVVYFAAVFKHYLVQNGIEVSGDLIRGEIPSKAKALVEFKGEPISKIIVDMNQYSNNFIAGQLVYALGQDSVGYFRQESGRKKIGEVLAKIGVQAGNYSITDGSGLSDRNRITARAIGTVLLSAYRDLGIYPSMISSLSRFEKSGTLKRRSLKLNARSDDDKKLLPLATLKGSVWAKTGTIDGVSSLAGYMTNAIGKKIVFVIISNGIMQKQLATQFEDGILQLIIDSVK